MTVWASLGSVLLAAALSVGDAAPVTLDVTTLEGHRTTVDLPGEVTIVDFFATWCPHCRESLAEYPAMIARLGGRARLIVVDVDEPPATVRAYFARHPVPDGVTLLLDPRGSAIRSFGPKSFPSLYVLDQAGVVRDVVHGWGRGVADELVRTANRILDPPRGQRRARSGRRGDDNASASEDARARRLGVEILH
jgi:thiol-disulfide isomerase/thioredoxin